MSYFGNRYLGKDAYRFSIYENEQLQKLVKAKLLRKSIVRRVAAPNDQPSNWNLASEKPAADEYQNVVVSLSSHLL